MLGVLAAVLVAVVAAAENEEISPYIELTEQNLTPYKRSARSARAADSYDSTKIYKMKEPIDSSDHGHKRCWNTGVFAVISAIEIAYTKYSKAVRKFSEQEVIDCFYKGCNPADAATVLRHIILQDRLAESARYTPYQAKVDMCRSAYAPDNLDRVQLDDVVSVTADNVEEAIREHGSVIACMDMGSVSCPDYRDYEGGIMDGNSADSCNHVVTIVGYGPDYYKVKEHRGPDWGEKGYFRVRRGGNACGVEFRMVAVKASKRARESYKKLTSMGCPVEMPVYCSVLRTCTTRGTKCVKPVKSRSKRDVEEVISREMRDAGEVMIREKRAEKCEDQPRYPCDRYKKMCGSIAKVSDRCKKTCGLCAADEGEAYTGKCKDDPRVPCSTYTDFCEKSPTVRLKCPATCRVPDTVCIDAEDNHPIYNKRPKPINGPCYIPRVANGRVYKDGRQVSGGMLDHGAKLIINCNKGYVLSGEVNHCGIQNVFGPDSRLMQTCNKVYDESYTGVGFDYKGMASEPVSQNVVCDNWNKLILQGRFHYFTTDLALAKNLMFGNHNYCRNSADINQPVPFCIAGSTSMGYCKKYPGCEGVCTGDEVNEDPYCDESASTRCPYVSEYKLNRNKDAWSYCRKSCCDLAGC